MNILLATDSFPPVCGGSGWSTYELARGLRREGHSVTVVQPRPKREPHVQPQASYDGFDVVEYLFAAPDVPYIRNYFKNERLTRTLALFLEHLIRARGIDIVHAQHVLTGPASIAAASRAGVPVVCTIRDYWPVCYWSDLIYDPTGSDLCPECSVANMARCIQPRGGAAWPAAIPLIPYMRRNLARKRHVLSRADAIIAVASVMAQDLRDRAPELHDARIEIIPNAVDVDAIRAAAAGPRSLDRPYLVYVGKLAPNKGVDWLMPAVANVPREWPLVIVGDGPYRSRLEAEGATSGRPVHFTGWLPPGDVLRWIAHAELLVFPSRGPESLSRVLLEAAALGTPIAAMATGGTRDIIVDRQTGLLSTDVSSLAADVATLARDPALRARLAAAGRAHVERTFSSASVVRRVIELYEELTSRRAGAQRPARRRHA